MDFFDLNNLEDDYLQWPLPNVPALPALPLPLDGIAKSQETMDPQMLSPLTTYSSQPEHSEATPLPPGANLEQSAPTSTGRVQAKCLLLTWSQAPQLSKEIIQAHLETIGDLLSLAVGQEAHQDGGTHYHACVIYQKKIDKRPSAFAILGSHPNVRTANRKIGSLAQSMMNMWNYVMKEDPNPLIVGPPPTLKRSRNEVYLEATEIATQVSVDAALDFVRLNAPADYVQKLDSINRNLVSHRNKKTRHLVPARPLSEFVHAPELPEDWHVLFIWGTSGVGKTQWAKAILPGATIVSHRNQLSDVDFSKGVIFDDFDVHHWPPTAAIHLVDWDEVRGIDIKHGYVITPPHTRKIFTFNKCLDDWAPAGISNEQFAAIRRRVHEIEINQCLF